MGAFLQESRPGFAPALDGTFSCFMARSDRIPLGGRSVRKSHVKAARRDARAAFLLRQARLTDSSEGQGPNRLLRPPTVRLLRGAPCEPRPARKLHWRGP